MTQPQHLPPHLRQPQRLYDDTTPQMEALQIQLWREATPARKMELLGQLNESARTLALMGLRQRFPHASEGELKYQLAILLLGAELTQKVYGDGPEAE
jgi:hypothetical protein